MFAGFLGEVSYDTAIVKDHLFAHLFKDNNKLYSAFIVVVRNPYDSLLAEFKRKVGKRMNSSDGGHTTEVNYDQLMKSKLLY